MSELERKTLNLTTRHWRCYNPAEYAGPVDVERAFDVARTAFVSLHLWNVGYPGGPPYPTDRFAMWMCSPEDTAIANEIVDNIIKPCLDAAREAGVTVFHPQPYVVADKYPISSLEWEPTDIPPYLQKRWGPHPVDEGPAAQWTDAIPGWSQERSELVHGPGYLEWEGAQQMDIHECCKPVEGEYVIKTSKQFERILRQLDIVNLVYVGFTTQGCILHTEGAIAPMSARGYRCMLVREGTHGVEYPDTREQRLMTKFAIRCVEQRYGLTIGAADFIRACRSASRKGMEG